MDISIQSLWKTLETQGSITGWPPTVSRRPLQSFDSVPSLESDTEPTPEADAAASKLGKLSRLYQSKDFKKIVDQLRRKPPDRATYQERLFLLLAYLQIHKDKEENLEQFALKLAQGLAQSEPSEFGELYEWLQNWLRGYNMPRQFHDRLTLGTTSDSLTGTAR